jgi:hypothetical protein
MMPNGGVYERKSTGANSSAAKEAAYGNEMMAAGEPSSGQGGATMY